MPIGDEELDSLLRPPKTISDAIDPELAGLLRSPAPTEARKTVRSPLSGEELRLNTESMGGASLGWQGLANLRNFSNLSDPMATVNYLSKHGIRAWYDQNIGQVLTQEAPGEASIVHRQSIGPGLIKDITAAAIGTAGWGLPVAAATYGLERGRQEIGKQIGTIGQPSGTQALAEGAGAGIGGFLGRFTTTIAGKAAGATPETIAEITKGTAPTQLPRAINIMRTAPEERKYINGVLNPAWEAAQREAEQMGVRKVGVAPAELQQAREVRGALKSIGTVPGRATAEEGISTFDLVHPQTIAAGGATGYSAPLGAGELKLVRVNGDELRTRLGALQHHGAIGKATSQANEALLDEIERIPSTMTMEDLDRYIRRDLRHSIKAQLSGKETSGMGKLKQELLLRASHEAKVFRDEELKRVLGPSGQKYVDAFSEASDHLGAIEDVLGRIVDAKGKLKPGATNLFRDFLTRPETGFRDSLLWLDQQMAKNGMPTQFAKRAQEQAMRRQLDTSNIAALQDIVRGRPQTRKLSESLGAIGAKVGAATMFTSPVIGRRAAEAFQSAFGRYKNVPPAIENP